MGMPGLRRPLVNASKYISSPSNSYCGSITVSATSLPVTCQLVHLFITGGRQLTTRHSPLKHQRALSSLVSQQQIYHKFGNLSNNFLDCERAIRFLVKTDFIVNGRSFHHQGLFKKIKKSGVDSHQGRS